MKNNLIFKLRFYFAFLLISMISNLALAGPIYVAVIDTGVNEIKAEEGWNFLTKSTDVKDTMGHGTKIAQIIQKTCDGCRIVPFKVSTNGSGIRVNDVAKAIRMALEKKARVINISFGMKAGTAELRSAVEEASEAGAIIISAAGRGIPNPYKPIELQKLFPQAFDEVIVVGIAESLSKPDDSINFGSEMDFVILSNEVDKNSSEAAAVVSGLVSKLLKRRPGYSLKPIRQLLRSATQQALHANPEKMGYGVLDVKSLWTAYLKEMDYRFYKQNNDSALIDFNLARDVHTLQPFWSCAKKGSDQVEVRDGEVLKNKLKRGRARIALDLSGVENCSLKIKIAYHDGAIKTYPINMN